MKKFLLLCLVLSNVLIAFAQKPGLNFETFGKWPRILSSQLSNNGKYAMYLVQNKLTNKYEWHVVSTVTSWESHVTANDIREPQFSPDNRFAFFIQAKDSLGVLDLKKGR